MNLEGIMINELNQRKSNTAYHHFSMKSSKYILYSYKILKKEYKKKRNTDKETKSVVTNGKRENLRGKIGVWD